MNTIVSWTAWQSEQIFWGLRTTYSESSVEQIIGQVGWWWNCKEGRGVAKQWSNTPPAWITTSRCNNLVPGPVGRIQLGGFTATARLPARAFWGGVKPGLLVLSMVVGGVLNSYFRSKQIQTLLYIKVTGNRGTQRSVLAFDKTWNVFLFSVVPRLCIAVSTNATLRT